MLNVGKYTIHGSYGHYLALFNVICFLRILPWDSSPFFTIIWEICFFFQTSKSRKSKMFSFLVAQLGEIKMGRVHLSPRVLAM